MTDLLGMFLEDQKDLPPRILLAWRASGRRRREWRVYQPLPQQLQWEFPAWWPLSSERPRRWNPKDRCLLPDFSGHPSGYSEHYQPLWRAIMARFYGIKMYRIRQCVIMSCAHCTTAIPPSQLTLFNSAFGVYDDDRLWPRKLNRWKPQRSRN